MTIPLIILQTLPHLNHPPLQCNLSDHSDFVPTLKINQKVNVTAIISLGREQPKPVDVKSAAQKMTLVKEDYVYEDETGTPEIHFWDELINKVTNE